MKDQLQRAQSLVHKISKISKRSKASPSLEYGPKVQQAWQLAQKTRLNAYAPYSHFKVGAVLKLQGLATMFTGCNYENASYGATICAERNALAQWIAHLGAKRKIDFILVIADTAQPTTPCGLCLQSLSEFADEKTKVYVANTKKILQQFRFQELLPSPFNTFKPQSN